MTTIKVENDRIVVTDAPDYARGMFNSIPAASDRRNGTWWYPYSPFSMGRLTRRLCENDINHRFGAGSDALVSQMRSMLHMAKLKDLAEIPVAKYLTTTTPWHHQRIASGWLDGNPYDYLAMKMGPQPLDSKILTPTGWTTMGEVEVGDLVIGSNGIETRVIEKLPPWMDEIYEVYFAHGEVVRCTKDHLWEVNTPLRDYNGFPPIVKTTGGMLASGLERAKGSHYRVRCCSPVAFDHREVPYDPWLIGFLIGDGCLAHSTPTFTKLDNEFQVNKVAECLPDGFSLTGSPNAFRVVDNNQSNSNRLIEYLRAENLNVLAAEKFIPDVYKYNHANARLEMLRGLCDTDAYVEDGKCTVEFSSASHQLSDDVIEIVRSLGGTASKSIKYVDGTPYWRVHFKLSVNPFSDPRKAGRWVAPTKYKPINAIRSIIPTTLIESVACIKVEADDGLYVTDDYILTHNTGKTMVAINELLIRQPSTTLIMCPKSVIDVWLDEFSIHAEGSDHLLIPLNKGTSKFKAEYAASKYRDAILMKRPAVFIVNYETAWREDVAKWILGLHPEVVIADESHRTKSAGSRVSRFAAKLFKRSQLRLLLSGTPLPNNQLDAYGQYRFMDPGIFGTNFARFRARYAQVDTFKGFPEITGWRNQEEFRSILNLTMFRVDEDVLDLPPLTHVQRYTEVPSKSRKLYERLMKSFVADVASGEVTASNALTRLMKFQQITSGFIIDDNGGTTELDREKEGALTDIIDGVKDEPVVVFCRFKHDLEVIRRVSDVNKRVYGEVSGSGNCLEGGKIPRGTDVLGVQIAAGGVGVNLNASRLCVFFSLGFSLAEYEQAVARLHRGGQTHPVTVYHLIARDTVDEHIYRALASKKKVVDEIMNYVKGEKQ